MCARTFFRACMVCVCARAREEKRKDKVLDFLLALVPGVLKALPVRMAMGTLHTLMIKAEEHSKLTFSKLLENSV